MEPFIVVGADGTPESAEALRFSYRHAKELGAGVLVLGVWQMPVSGELSPTKTEADYQAVASEQLTRTVSLAGDAPAGVGLTIQLVQHNPALALVDAAKGALMLVVGSHWYGEVQAPHLGSVASYCVHHAACPVLVYRTSEATHRALSS